MLRIIRWVYYDMFKMIRDCMKDISFGDFSLYDFLISVLVFYLCFRAIMAIVGNYEYFAVREEKRVRQQQWEERRKR